jgi:hypothetical protein
MGPRLREMRRSRERKKIKMEAEECVGLFSETARSCGLC